MRPAVPNTDGYSRCIYSTNALQLTCDHWHIVFETANETDCNQEWYRIGLACHEIGHTVGLEHGPTPSVHECMPSKPSSKFLGTHSVGHITPSTTQLWLCRSLPAPEWVLSRRERAIHDPFGGSPPVPGRVEAMNGLRRRVLDVLLAASSMLLAGCVETSTDRQVRTEETADAVFAWDFTEPKDLVATAPVIVLGTVERVDRGRVLDKGEETETTRLLTVRIEKQLAGRVTADHLVIEDQGWVRLDGNEVPFRLVGMLRLEKGDRAYLFLRRSPGSSYYEQLNHQAAYRLQGNKLAASSRDDAMTRLVELMTADQLEQLIGQGLTEVKEGRRRATPAGLAGAG